MKNNVESEKQSFFYNYFFCLLAISFLIFFQLRQFFIACFIRDTLLPSVYYNAERTAAAAKKIRLKIKPSY